MGDETDASLNSSQVSVDPAASSSDLPADASSGLSKFFSNDLRSGALFWLTGVACFFAPVYLHISDDWVFFSIILALLGGFLIFISLVCFLYYALPLYAEGQFKSAQGFLVFLIPAMMLALLAYILLPVAAFIAKAFVLLFSLLACISALPAIPLLADSNTELTQNSSQPVPNNPANQQKNILADSHATGVAQNNPVNQRKNILADPNVLAGALTLLAAVLQIVVVLLPVFLK